MWGSQDAVTCDTELLACGMDVGSVSSALIMTNTPCGSTANEFLRLLTVTAAKMDPHWTVWPDDGSRGVPTARTPFGTTPTPTPPSWSGHTSANTPNTGAGCWA